MVRTCSILVNIMVKLSTERRFPPDVQGSHQAEERRKPPAPAWRTREGAPCAERAARAPKSLENALTFRTTCLQFSQCATRGWASPPPPGPAPTSPHHWGQTSLLGGTTHCPRGNWLFTLVMLPAPESLARSLAADNNTSVMHPCCPSWPAGVSRSPCRRPRLPASARVFRVHPAPALAPHRPAHPSFPSAPDPPHPQPTLSGRPRGALAPGSWGSLSSRCKPWREGTPPRAGSPRDPQKPPDSPLCEAGAQRLSYRPVVAELRALGFHMAEDQTCRLFNRGSRRKVSGEEEFLVSFQPAGWPSLAAPPRRHLLRGRAGRPHESRRAPRGRVPSQTQPQIYFHTKTGPKAVDLA